jgi:hypothetical protein
LPEKSNGKFLRCLLVFFSLFIAKHGPDMLLNQLESVQAGLLEQFLTHVWAPKLALVVTDATDKKICQVSVKKRKKKKSAKPQSLVRCAHNAHSQKRGGGGGGEEVGGLPRACGAACGAFAYCSLD